MPNERQKSVIVFDGNDKQVILNFLDDTIRHIRNPNAFDITFNIQKNGIFLSKGYLFQKGQRAKKVFIEENPKSSTQFKTAIKNADFIVKDGVPMIIKKDGRFLFTPSYFANLPEHLLFITILEKYIASKKYQPDDIKVIYIPDKDIYVFSVNQQVFSKLIGKDNDIEYDIKWEPTTDSATIQVNFHTGKFANKLQEYLTKHHPHLPARIVMYHDSFLYPAPNEIYEIFTPRKETYNTTLRIMWVPKERDFPYYHFRVSMTYKGTVQLTNSNPDLLIQGQWTREYQFTANTVEEVGKRLVDIYTNFASNPREMLSDYTNITDFQFDRFLLTSKHSQLQLAPQRNIILIDVHNANAFKFKEVSGYLTYFDKGNYTKPFSADDSWGWYGPYSFSFDEFISLLIRHGIFLEQLEQYPQAQTLLDNYPRVMQQLLWYDRSLLVDFAHQHLSLIEADINSLRVQANNIIKNILSRYTNSLTPKSQKYRKTGKRMR